MQIIATIELDQDEGQGNIFWKNGTLWVERDFDGEIWDTENPCPEHMARSMARRLWNDCYWNFLEVK